MDPKLIEVLNKCHQQNVSSSAPETHFTFFGPTKGWTIPNNTLCDFWYEYCCAVNSDIGGAYYLGEKVNVALNPAVPLTAMLTFRFEKEGIDISNLFGDDFKIGMILCFQTVIEEMLKCESKDDREFICCYYENETPTITDKHVILKIRLQFPLCPVEVVIQRDHLKPKIVSKLRADNVMRLLMSQPVDGWENIIDMSFKEPIPMYGSRKDQNESTMILNDIFSKINIEDEQYVCEPLQVDDLYIHMSTHRDVLNDSVVMDAIEDWVAENDNDPSFVLPMLMSMWFPKGQISLKRGASPMGKVPMMSKKTVTLDPMEDLCNRLLNLLSPNRFRKRNYWLDIGRALLSCFKNQEIGLETWKGWTTRHGGPSERECEEMWYQFRDERLTLNTIGWYALEDNEHDYRLVMKRFCDRMREKSLSLGHTDIAEALYYEVMWLDVAFDGKDWYRFENHRWIKCEGGIMIRKMMTTKFIPIYEKWRTSVSKEQENIEFGGGDDDEEEQNNAKKNKGEEKIDKIGKIIMKLKDVRFRSNIMKALEDVTLVENFRKMIDNNPCMIGVANGVIEISEGEALFRSGKPEDYITMTTSTRYNPELTYNHPSVQKLEKWLNQMFTDKELNRHFKKDCASFLYGKNAEKIFRIYSGAGDNSKSMLMKLLQLCLGSYCCDLPITMLTGQRTQADAPSPSLAQTKSTRIAFLSEPSAQDVINPGVLKAFSSGDRYYARALNDNGGSIEATFKMILTCNRIPSIIGDKAIHNRLRVIPFMSSWVDNPPAKEEEQYEQRLFKKDPMFEKCIPELAPAMLWMMVNWYPIYNNEGLAQDPAIVKEMTAKYWSETDAYDNFIAEKITKVYKDNDKKIPDESRYITGTEMYSAFKQYFVSAFGKGNIPTAPLARSEFVSRLGPLKSNRWIGLLINEEEE